MVDIHWSCQQIQCFIKTHADWRVSYSLDHHLYTGLATVLSLSLHDNEHVTAATGLQGCLLLLGTWSHLQCNGGPCLLEVVFDHHIQTNHQRFLFLPIMTFRNFGIILDHGMPNCDKEHTAGATDQQGMLTLPRHHDATSFSLMFFFALSSICISLHGF